MEMIALKNNYEDLTELEEKLMAFLILDCNVCGVTIVRKNKKDILTDGDTILSHFNIHNVKRIMFLEDNSVIIQYKNENIRFIAE